MQKYNSLYKEIILKFLGIEVDELNKNFTSGSEVSSFFIAFEEVKVHRLCAVRGKDYVVELFFLERGNTFSPCKYVITRGGKIETVKVFKYSYKALNQFCTDLKLLIPQELKAFLKKSLVTIKNTEEKSSKKSSDKPVKSKAKDKEDKDE